MNSLHFLGTGDVSEYQWPFNCGSGERKGRGGGGRLINKQKDIYLALESMSMVLKRLKSDVFIPGTVLAWQECVICRKRKKKKGRSGYQTHERCEIINGAETLIAHADSDTDEYMSLELQDLTIADILAKEFMYHRSFYRNICRIEKQVVNSKEIQEKRVREECFNDLKAIVQVEVFKNGEFMRLGSVADN